MNLNEWLDVGVKLIVALLCSALIGYEREVKEKPAGLRTHVLVCLGAAMVGIVAVRLVGRYGADGLLDPLRVLSAVVIGIGFVGAGSILHEKGSVYGLTTAAALWVVAAVGVSIGLGEVGVALLVTLLAFLILTGLRLAERSKHTTHAQ